MQTFDRVTAALGGEPASQQQQEEGEEVWSRTALEVEHRGWEGFEPAALRLPLESTFVCLLVWWRP